MSVSEKPPLHHKQAVSLAHTHIHTSTKAHQNTQFWQSTYVCPTIRCISMTAMRCEWASNTHHNAYGLERKSQQLQLLRFSEYGWQHMKELPYKEPAHKNLLPYEIAWTCKWKSYGFPNKDQLQSQVVQLTTIKNELNKKPFKYLGGVWTNL